MSQADVAVAPRPKRRRDWLDIPSGTDPRATVPASPVQASTPRERIQSRIDELQRSPMERVWASNVPMPDAESHESVRVAARDVLSSLGEQNAIPMSPSEAFRKRRHEDTLRRRQGQENQTEPSSSRKSLRSARDRDAQDSVLRQRILAYRSGNSRDQYDDLPDYTKPIRCVDNRPQFERLAEWAETMSNNYKAQLYPEEKSRTYSNPAHTKITLSGDERLFGLRTDLAGFDPLPIELQILMHEAAFSIQGPVIYREE